MTNPVTEFAMLIDGRSEYGRETAEVHNPSTGELVGLCPLGSLDQLDLAVTAAARAFRGWSGTGDAARQAACHAIGSAIEAHAEELAHLLTLEQGKPLNFLGSRFEVGGAQAWTHSTADLSLEPELIQNSDTGRIELHRKPIGVVGSITPWNWPLMIAVWHILPAIRSGNTVVLKPSPFTPLSTLRMVEIIGALLPPGVLNVVTGGAEIGTAMSAHPGIGKIVFTGSTATGCKVMAGAAGTLKRLTLELGGNDAGIVLHDARPEDIAGRVFWGAFVNNGQTCAALKRLYVPDSLYGRMCDALVDYARTIRVGDGLDEASELGPMQNGLQRDKVGTMVDQARSQGGRVLMGGAVPEGAGYFYPITLVADATDEMALVRCEQFGPALPILRYGDVDEAVARANASDSGLGGSVWSSDAARARSVAGRLECGTAWINLHGALQPNVPFGGVKNSGLGVEFGRQGLEEYTTIQVVNGTDWSAAG